MLAEDTLALIVTDTTTELPDSLVFWLGAASDSLLKHWVDTMRVNTGMALVVADSGRARLSSPRVVCGVEDREVAPSINRRR